MMNINSTRFGNIQTKEEDVITFRDGMVGLPNLKKYVLVESPSMPLVVWMQSCENPSIAFPLIEPEFFHANYNVNMTDADRFSLSFEQNDSVKTFCILTIPQNAEAMTVNLRGPIVMNLTKGVATQVILQDKTYEVRRSAFDIYMQAMGRAPVRQSASESESTEWNVVSVRSDGVMRELQ
jgi:flagellar assembly factor FliW